METSNKSISKVSDLFYLGKPIKVPAYQRAYAWEEKQVNQFIDDLYEFKGRSGYYFGHFILENNDGKYFEIIDGQQRLTTFILFLMVCKVYNPNSEVENYISKFDTVEYDSENLKTIQQQLTLEKEWDFENFKMNDTNASTLSIKKIIEALNIFKKAFLKRLQIEYIKDYISVITDALASAHITPGKEIAVQIFELHNTRGIQLNTIEKVKAKLMRAVYKHNTTGSADDDVKEIQNAFAEIFRMEEEIANKSFRGDLQLDELLLSHLRVIDDGTKLAMNQNRNEFNSPARGGNREEAILKYIDENTGLYDNENHSQYVEYSKRLADEFLISTKILCNQLPKLDEINSLVGDTLIFERDLSTEFYLILFRLIKGEYKFEIFQLWEKLLFIRDFHDKYYKLLYRDNFQRLFLELITDSKRDESITTITIINKFIKEGFRSEKLEGDLDEVVLNYLKNNKTYIIKNGFNWWKEKNVYILYKYEKSLNNSHHHIREFMKSNRSIEHILPQEWKWEWFVKDDKNITDADRKVGEKINLYINGIGNLLIISKEKNSGLGNNHPKDKEYYLHNEALGGSYEEHNDNRQKWNHYESWETIIEERGNKIYEFMMRYFFNK